MNNQKLKIFNFEDTQQQYYCLIHYVTDVIVEAIPIEISKHKTSVTVSDKQGKNMLKIIVNTYTENTKNKRTLYETKGNKMFFLDKHYCFIN